MSAFTDRLVAAGIDQGTADRWEADLRQTMATAMKQRDEIQAQVDALQLKKKPYADEVARIRSILRE